MYGNCCQVFQRRNAHGGGTRLLNLVRVDGKTAADLYETMKIDLAKHSIEIKHLVRFAADTTNVIFGNNKIASRITNANNQCGCHSCALTVSHACAMLPRHLQQLVKGVLQLLCVFK